MFKIAEEIMAKIETVLTANALVLAGNNGIKLASHCVRSCTGTCEGSCANTCSRSCKGNSR